MVLELEGLTVRYGAKTALSEVSLRFEGGALGLLGPNGAGKTTLLRTLLGFLAPAGGSARVLEMDPARQPLAVRARVGLMPEVDCHIPGMNAIRFVAYAGELCGMSAVEAMQRAHELLYYVGLGEARYRDLQEYSTGMKQRIKLAQALMHDPELLLLDEPTNGLDPRGRGEMLELVRDLAHGKGVHVLLSSHLLPDVERVCDVVAVLHRGRLVVQDQVANLKALSGRSYLVRLRGEVQLFAERAETAGLGLRRGRDEDLIVTLPEPASTLELFRLARDSGVQLRHLAALERTLEDAFADALAEAEGAARS